MEIKVWSPELTDKEVADVAYWERNMLALHLADGYYLHEGEGFEGWSRVLSIFGGRATFHVPDDFDIGDLRLIPSNWDGHTTKEKWAMIKSLNRYRYLGKRVEKNKD